MTVPNEDPPPPEGKASLQWLEDATDRFLKRWGWLLVLGAAYILYRAVRTA